LQVRASSMLTLLIVWNWKLWRLDCLAVVPIYCLAFGLTSTTNDLLETMA